MELAQKYTDIHVHIEKDKRVKSILCIETTKYTNCNVDALKQPEMCRMHI